MIQVAVFNHTLIILQEQHILKHKFSFVLYHKSLPMIRFLLITEQNLE